MLTACLCLSSKGAEPVFRNPRVKLLWDKWRNVWMLAWERQRRLQEKYSYLLELEKVKNFSWDDWRKRVSMLIIYGLKLRIKLHEYNNLSFDWVIKHCYHSVQSLLSSCLLCGNIKVKI
jgi:hypothetical protein